MSAAHTPAPWNTGGSEQDWSVSCDKLGETASKAIYANGQIVGFAASYDRNFVEFQNVNANAQLISAAPELLEALQELADCGAEAWGEDRPCVRIAREAISKALATA